VFNGSRFNSSRCLEPVEPFKPFEPIKRFKSFGYLILANCWRICSLDGLFL
jgi:hypothetical protein